MRTKQTYTCSTRDNEPVTLERHSLPIHGFSFSEAVGDSSRYVSREMTPRIRRGRDRRSSPKGKRVDQSRACLTMPMKGMGRNGEAAVAADRAVRVRKREREIDRYYKNFNRAAGRRQKALPPSSLSRVAEAVCSPADVRGYCQVDR